LGNLKSYKNYDSWVLHYRPFQEKPLLSELFSFERCSPMGHVISQDDNSDLRKSMESGSSTPGRKTLEIFRTGIFLVWNRRNSLGPTISLPYCPAWDVLLQNEVKFQKMSFFTSSEVVTQEIQSDNRIRSESDETS
jgi:hypothetical protein